MPKGPYQDKPGPEPKLNEARVIAALENTGGIKKAAAEQLGVGRTTLYNFINANPSIKATISEIDETVIDMAEGKVIKAIKDGDMQTVRWYLEMKGGPRGYSRNNTHSGPGGRPIAIEMPTLDTTALSMSALKEIRAALIASDNEPD